MCENTTNVYNDNKSVSINILDIGSLKNLVKRVLNVLLREIKPLPTDNKLIMFLHTTILRLY